MSSRQVAEITTEEFDRMFDEGEDVSAYLDFEKGVHLNRGDEVRKVNLSVPGWVLETAEARARHRGVTRSSVLLDWLADAAEAERAAC